MTLYVALKNKLFFPVYIFCILAITILLGLRPNYNWDMLPYMFIIQKMDGIKSSSQIHANIYEAAQQNLSEKKYNELINPHNNYRKKMAEDAAAFEKQLPFFDIKPAYLISAFTFYKMGVGLTFATVLPSLIAYFFINLVSFIWLKKLGLSFKILIPALLIICIITAPLATRSNPDTLACLFLLTSAYFFLESDNLFCCVLFLILSILTRPENIIFCFLLLSIVLAQKWKKKVSLFLSSGYLLLMIIIYFLVIKGNAYPGWNNLFYHAFIDNTVDPFVKQTITVPVYFKVLGKTILNARGIIAMFCLLVVTAFVFSKKIIAGNEQWVYYYFYIVVIIWTIIKTLLFPMTTLRFIIPPVLLLFFVIVKKYKLLNSKKVLYNAYSII